MSLPAANLVTSVLTVTNLPQTSNVFYFAGSSSSSLRTWTNQTTANTILTNLGAGLGGAATNLFNALANYPLLGITSISQTNTNVLVFKAVSLVVTQGGNWASIVTTTNTGTNVYSFVGPFDDLPPTTRTNQASEFSYGLGIYGTNPIPATALVLSNYATRFTSQTLSNKSLWSSHLNNGDIGLGSGGTEIYRGNLLYYDPFENNNGIWFQNLSAAYASLIRPNTNGMPGLLDANTLTALDGRTTGNRLNDEVILNWYTSRQFLALLAPYLGDAAGNNAITVNQFTIPNTFFNANTFSGTNTFQSEVDFTGSLNAYGGSVALTNVVQAVKNQTVTNQTVLSGSQSNVTSVNCYFTNSSTTGSNRVNAVFSTRYDLSTLADGNNIAVAVGTNQFIRLTQGGLTTGATICGLVGAGTSGSGDGHYLNILNDSTLNATFSQNTVDPVPANRITTQAGADVVVPNKGWIELAYESATSRWRVRNAYPQTNLVANATNAIGNSSGFGTNTTLYAATVIPTTGNLTLSNLTASRALLLNAAGQATNEPDATLANLSSLPIKNYTNAITSLRTNTVSVGSVTGVNWGYGITGVVASGQANLGVSIAAASQWGLSAIATALAQNTSKYLGLGVTVTSTTNTSFLLYPAANFTVTGIGISTSSATLGTGTNITYALQTNTVDAVTGLLTGNASRTHALTSALSIPVTTNDYFCVRWVCDGAVASQIYNLSVSYTIP